ncbi:pyridoxamine 5'-phosphate oxidase [Thermostichus sp. MS-CIW-21]|jgi:PPOX class probable FMN-dependent enzyme|uniref:Npun_F5749 family FMN-dependent PPOX-type flavoprotein n=1 Tax=unclassified Synechococcus TaxID=2626047 RepID=UPI0000694606|nr:MULTISPECIES: Npun_F5749 family FMN-dependent PPOX-type flavoprotein [unclassified Synechococcus]ABD00128.1 pyridoxamine 5'-phosphate oxidase family protein [Synechococcus sp. JA-3-3Ab]PIK86974.1 pyridoxamine 5'-phosphate oxidase [Synechococcus sp. 63AY4M2]PIK87892.1 pyridoxamine 5'-phosphate oxidase [Synechococcus sp. 65AY6A5]PIK92331.1 pyridoxamine 5'-phosphate oxidase [Synechococcus sp. 65AY6Li]PIK96045.1 pyridoxamine 5'-phosphate oxidase [Synechococcus sp. 60AY4M2]
MNELKDNPAGDPSWRTLLQAALHRNRSDAGVRYLQLATVDPWGHPRNRTVVFRGFLGDTDRIQLAVDSRSEKICQIAHCPLAQICWYFCKTREQFRIAGTLEAITADHPDPRAQQHRQQLWQQISEKGRLLWFWPEPKGPLAPPEAFVEELPPEKASLPPPTFVLLLLDPTEVDHLQLKGDAIYPQRRTLYERSPQGWKCRAVNP